MFRRVPVLGLLVCAFARHPGPLTPGLELLPDQDPEPDLYQLVPEARYLQYEDSPNIYIREDLYGQPDDLLTKEISLLKRLEGFNQDTADYNVDYSPEQPTILLARLLGLGSDYQKYTRNQPLKHNEIEIRKNEPEKKINNIEKEETKETPETKAKSEEEIELQSLPKRESKSFAYTPLDAAYFDGAPLPSPIRATQPTQNEIIEARKTRQNPNRSRAKTLLSENIDQLRLGFTDKDTGSTTGPQHIHIIESVTPESASPLYGTALLAAVVAALSMAAVGFVFGWYTLSKKAKAAADVDYPAYGVTGPTVDPNGDRKLAHSAHMYHYQHQKQQILAMESCLGRTGSVSDPDSEEENEEGDYTVYECPGFATTGNMEVKNPLFSEDPTPATPGKCEVVQQQPKD